MEAPVGIFALFGIFFISIALRILLAKSVRTIFHGSSNKKNPVSNVANGQQTSNSNEDNLPVINLDDDVANNIDDVGKNKAMAIVGYVIPVLFFIPLVIDAKNSPFARFHASQQLVLLIAAIAVNMVGGIIPFIGWFIILPIGTIAVIVLAIMGIINASKGEMKKLPIIGGFELIK